MSSTPARDQLLGKLRSEDGAGIVMLWEERPMPLNLLAAYGAGIQVHIEDLASHLAGRGRCDATARFAELFPAYRELAAGAGG